MKLGSFVTELAVHSQFITVNRNRSSSLNTKVTMKAKPGSPLGSSAMRMTFKYLFLAGFSDRSIQKCISK